MKVLGIYKEEYKHLREQLFNLKFKISVGTKVLEKADYLASKEEIDRIKRQMGNIIHLSSIDNKGGMNK